MFICSGRRGFYRSLVALLSMLLCTSCSPGPWGCPNPSPQSSTPSESVAASFSELSDPYALGPLDVQRIDLDACAEGTPFPVTIYAPKSGGRYPVLLFEHGLVVDHNLYSEILTQIASHGIVAVAPQTYRPGTLPIGVPTVEEEIGRVRGVLDWAAGNLARVTGVDADLTALAVGGHSRGGPVAWLLAREDPGRVKALIGVDPVDGAGGIFGPPTLVGPFDLGIPALIVAAGAGDIPTAVAGTPCAPDGHNYVQFFDATAAPVWQIVVPGAGHLDVFDYCEGYPYCQFCTHGFNPAGMRQLTAGVVTAFLRASLQGESSGYDYLTNPAAAQLPFEVSRK